MLCVSEAPADFISALAVKTISAYDLELDAIA